MKQILDTTKAVALGLLITAQAFASTSDNKATAVSAMTGLFTRQDPSAVDKFFTSPYHQHNTRIPDGLEALKQLAQMATKWPGVHTTIYRSLGDGDLVVLHSEYWNLLNRQQKAVAFDLFRFDKDGKIVEHWDALEPRVKADSSGRTQINGAKDIQDVDKTESNRTAVFAYIDQVKIAGKSAAKGQFVNERHYVEHQPRQPRTFSATQEDLTGSVKLSLADLRYVARHRSVAEGNFVFVQGEGRLKSDDIVEIYDLFRLQDGKIVEHWNVFAPLAPKSQWANTNGPF